MASKKLDISTTNFTLLLKAKLITKAQYAELSTKQKLALSSLTKGEVNALISIRKKIKTFDSIIDEAGEII